MIADCRFDLAEPGNTFQAAVVIDTTMADDLISNYKAKHQHPVNRFLHTIGIPTIIVSYPLFFFNWRWALALFIGGWILQFVGHAIEGNQPAFFKNPVYLFVGPMWLVRRAGAVVGLSKPKPLK